MIYTLPVADAQFIRFPDGAKLNIGKISQSKHNASFYRSKNVCLGAVILTQVPSHSQHSNKKPVITWVLRHGWQVRYLDLPGTLHWCNDLNGICTCLTRAHLQAASEARDADPARKDPSPSVVRKGSQSSFCPCIGNTLETQCHTDINEYKMRPSRPNAVKHLFFSWAGNYCEFHE